MLAAAKVAVPEAAVAKTMKGIGFTNVRHYVLEKHGEAGWTRLLSRMLPADRAQLQTVVPVGWYDVRLFSRLLRNLDQTFGRGDLRLLRDVGAHEAEQDFNRVLRVFLRVLTPGSIFRAEARLWRHFQNSGEWSTQPIPGGMRAVLTGWENDPALCEELAGYLVRLVRFTGGQNVTVTHERCLWPGKPAWMFNYRWD